MQEITMTTYASRREFLRHLGIGAAAVPFVLNLPSLGFASPRSPAPPAAHRHVQPQRRRSRRRSGRMKKATKFTLKESLKPLEPFQDRTLIAARRLRQDPRRRRQPHARHRLPAHRHRALPRQHPGRLRHAGRLGERHLDRPGNQKLPAERTRQRARASARSNSASWCPTGPIPGRACRTPAPTSRSRRSTIRTRCSPSSTAA